MAGRGECGLGRGEGLGWLNSEGRSLGPPMANIQLRVQARGQDSVWPRRFQNPGLAGLTQLCSHSSLVIDSLTGSFV